MSDTLSDEVLDRKQKYLPSHLGDIRNLDRRKQNILYDPKTKTGLLWQKQWHGGYNFSYMENGEHKPFGTEAFRFVKRSYHNIKDNPITQSIIEELNESAELMGEAQIQRAEANIEASRVTGDALVYPIKATQNILNNTYGTNTHPLCFETFGEHCTINEYNKKMSDSIYKNGMELLHNHKRDEGEVDVNY